MALQYSTVLVLYYCTVLYSTVLSTVQYCTVYTYIHIIQYSTVLYTVLYSTVQYSSVVVVDYIQYVNVL